MSNDEHPSIKTFWTITTMNVIAIVRNVLFLYLLFWKSQTVIDCLRFFQVSFYEHFKNFGP